MASHGKQLLEADAEGFVHPDYNGHSLVNVANSISMLLGGTPTGIPLDESLYKDAIDIHGIKKVVMVVLDGFGYEMLLDAKNAPFFRKFANAGVLKPITTGFPSTTAASITTINTGLTPQEHGLPEWVIYLNEISMLVNSLPFTSLIGNEQLAGKGVDPSVLYEGTTIYQKLKRQGIPSIAFMHKSLVNTAYTKVMRKGSVAQGFANASDGILELGRKLESVKGKAYINFYVDNIDSATHFYGPKTDQSRAAIESLSCLFEKELVSKVATKAAEETLIVLTADHGHIGVDGQKTLFLNNDRKLLGMFKKGRDGKHINPSGSARDVFLNVEERHVDEACDHLSRRLKGIAKVMKTEDAISSGLFGTGKVSSRFRDRIGNILLLPYGNGKVWYEHVKGVKSVHKGEHGGLSSSEMLIPLAMSRLSDLKQ